MFLRCAIWYYLHNLKNVKSTHGEVLLLAKLQAQVCKFAESNTPPWVFFTFFKLYKWSKISQSITTNALILVFIVKILIINQLVLKGALGRIYLKT